MDPLFNTTALLGVLATLDRPTAWLRDRYFPDPIQFLTAEIAFDKLAMRRKLAPFVSPRVAGRARAGRGRTVQTFEPAYVKPKDEVSPDEAFVRWLGETFGSGTMTPEQRFMANVMQKLADQDAEITRREEWMCAQILQAGSVVVQGEDYPAQTVDFARHEDLTVELGENSRWGDNGVEVLEDIKDWSALVSEKSGGTVRDVVLGSQAARLFTKDAEVRAILDNRRQATGRMELAPVVTGGQNMVAAYLGSVGQFDFYQYSQNYELEDGTIEQMFPAYGCLLVAPDAHNGAMCHGAIRDKKSLRAEPRFPKMWDQEDPSTTFLMTQSAPLPVPREVNATMFATVGVAEEEGS